MKVSQLLAKVLMHVSQELNCERSCYQLTPTGHSPVCGSAQVLVACQLIPPEKLLCSLLMHRFVIPVSLGDGLETQVCSNPRQHARAPPDIPDSACAASPPPASERPSCYGSVPACYGFSWPWQHTCTEDESEDCWTERQIDKHAGRLACNWLVVSNDSGNAMQKWLSD